MGTNISSCVANASKRLPARFASTPAGCREFHDPALRAAVQETQFLSPLTRGLTLRYGIFIRSDCRSDRTMVIHELGHTAQYERLGGFEPFLRQYLFECLTIGYPEAPMEQEVIELTARICDSQKQA